MKTCEKCGQNFSCSMSDKTAPCWCTALGELKPLPKEYKDCLCPRCLAEFSEADYYLENGNLVFTPAYHRRRGYCCENNCRHCPYKETTK